MKKLTFTFCALAGMTALGLAAGEDKKMEAPKPPQEIGDMMKSMTGSWKCEGTFAGMGGGAAMKYTSTMKPKSELAGFWVHESVTITPSDKKAMPGNFLIEAWMTYDSSAKMWRRVEMMSDGGLMVGTSAGAKDMKMEMNGTNWGPHGESMMKTTVDMTDMKKGIHVVGQMSMDKGKTWNQLFDETCKK